MKRLLLIALLTFAGCSNGEIVKKVRGPAGVTAEIIESRHGASAANTVRMALVSADGTKRVEIFKGSGGSSPSIFFRDKMVIIQYCYPSNYEASGYIYSLGDDYSFSDVRIASATVESQIGSLRLCSDRSVRAVTS